MKKQKGVPFYETPCTGPLTGAT